MNANGYYYKRKPLTSLSKAQKLWGAESTTFIRPQYIKGGYCQWCGKQIIGKRKKLCCSAECSRKFKVAIYSLYYENCGSRSGYANHILRRDNYTCQKCGKFHGVINEHGIKLPTTDGELEIHHINQVQHGGGDSPDNLMTVCKKCHKSIHGERSKQ